MYVMSRASFLGPLLLLSAAIIVSCRLSPQQYVAKGNAFYDSGKYDDAILNYKKAIQKDSKLGEGYYRLGLAYVKTGAARDAYGALHSANALLPDRADVKVTFADFLLVGYFSSKDRPTTFYKQLIQLSEDFIAKDPNSYDGLRIKAVLAWTDGNFKEAEDLFQRANTKKPMQPALVQTWVQVLFQDGQPQEAERLALQLIQAHKDAGPIYDILYAHYRSKNRLADAESILRSKMNNNPRDINAAVELAMFYAAANKRDQMTA